MAETHQTLIQNGLRNRVVVETDGKLMSGRDVAIAAILGAEEYGFATAPLVTLGCVMMRVCNLDTCPMGVATQNPELRKRFMGKPEYVENFMRFIAQELREYMAKLGVKSVDELVGRTDLLRKRTDLSGVEAKIDVSAILGDSGAVSADFHDKSYYDFKLDEKKDKLLMTKNRKFMDAVIKGEPTVVGVDVINTDRAFGTLIGSEITRHHHDGLKADTITVNCKGSGGQSFGAFIPAGLTLNLVGDSNDYFGKGLSGGKLIVKTPADAAYNPQENIIVGNVALYGATSGEAYVGGMAGERFCVRNSGAKTVVEGVGEHGCEYMTGGVAVIIGPTGKNFAAGMSGGIAYVLDENNSLYRNLNKEMVLMESIEHKSDREELKKLLENHAKYTGSAKAKLILDNFDEYLPKFKKIIPSDYKKIVQYTEDFIEHGMSIKEAQIEAFYKSQKENA